MKTAIVVILSLYTLTGVAQSSLVPGKNAFDKKWIKPGKHQMAWYAMKDTVSMQVGVVTTQVLTDNNYLTIVTEVNMKGAKAPWIDSTIAHISDMAPIRHSSYNMQRDMVLDFGKIVTGYYTNKLKQVNYLVSDTTAAAYFDSNLYPSLITWLPLKDGYKQDISIYDYNPSGKTGIIKASIEEVSSGQYSSTSSGVKDVWIVRVKDEIGNSDKDFMTYYIDKKDRRLWRQDINAGGRKMKMVFIEQ